MDVEKLIELVRERKILYESNGKSYKDVNKKESAWREIAEQLQQDGKSRNCSLCVR